MLGLKGIGCFNHGNKKHLTLVKYATVLSSLLVVSLQRR